MNNSIGRALLVGLILAIAAIGLFLFLYYVALAGFDSVVQLFGSLCIPPVLIFFVVSGYYVLTDDEDKNRGDVDSDND